MNDEIMVSVWCLTYNHEKYIRDCLEGFVNQKTNFRFEVIVHDDASTDRTADIIKEYADKYPDIIKPILQKENQYSKGVNIIKEYIKPNLRGKYVAVCEGDDFWSNNTKLQIQVDILERHQEYVACVHQTQVINCLNKKETLLSKYNDDVVISERDILSNNNPVYHTSSLCYRKVLMDSEPEFVYFLNPVWDYPFGIYLSLKGNVYFLNKIMSTYRLFTEESWSLKSKGKDMEFEFVNNKIDLLSAADQYSNYKYHKVIDAKILDFEYTLWKMAPSFSILKKDRFKRLKISQKIKLCLKALKSIV